MNEMYCLSLVGYLYLYVLWILLYSSIAAGCQRSSPFLRPWRSLLWLRANLLSQVPLAAAICCCCCCCCAASRLRMGALHASICMHLHAGAASARRAVARWRASWSSRNPRQTKQKAAGSLRASLGRSASSRPAVEEDAPPPPPPTTTTTIIIIIIIVIIHLLNHMQCMQQFEQHRHQQQLQQQQTKAAADRISSRRNTNRSTCCCSCCSRCCSNNNNNGIEGGASCSPG